MFNYEVTCSAVNEVGDSRLRIKVGDFEVSVVFDVGVEDMRNPSDIRIFDMRNEQCVSDITQSVFGRDHVPVNSFADIAFAIATVERKFYNK